MFNNYNEIKTYLDKLGMFRMKAGQDRILNTLEQLKLLPLPYKAVQIVGTNGKGSTSTFLSTLSVEHAVNTGLFTSPHFISVKERILVNNKQVSDEIWLKCANKVYEASNDLTYFEFITVLSVLIYKECNCTIVFFEAGLGGKFDATTALNADICIFTPIALDHCNILGSSIEEIAEDKAYAILPSTKFALSAIQDKKAEEKINIQAEKYNIPVYYANNIDKDIRLTMQGEHQYANAALARLAWQKIASEILNIESITQKEVKALEKAFIAGRLQIIPQEKSPIEKVEIILDGGHNLHGLEAINSFFNTYMPAVDENYIIFSCLADKDINNMLEIIEKIAANMNSANKIKMLIPIISDNPRASNSQDLANAFINSIYIEAIAHKNLDENLKYLHNRKNKNSARVLICGSLYLLAEFYAIYPQFLEK